MSKKKEKFVDDGRTIANMNVEGMPWYHPEKGDSIRENGDPAKNNAPKQTYQDELTPAGRRSMMLGVLGAAMLIAFIFIAVYFLFILFCSKVWLQ